MASFGGKTFQRWILATIPSRGLADSKEAAAFRGGWDESTSRIVQVPPVRQASGVSMANGFHGTVMGVERIRSNAPLPCSGSDWSESEQACPRRSSGDPAKSGLGTAKVALGGPGNGESGGASVDTTRQELDGTKRAESRLASPAHSSEYVIAEASVRWGSWRPVWCQVLRELKLRL